MAFPWKRNNDREFPTKQFWISACAGMTDFLYQRELGGDGDDKQKTLQDL